MDNDTGAVRSTDLAVERWDLISYAAVNELGVAMKSFNNYDLPVMDLVGVAIYYAGRFLGGYPVSELFDGWAYLAVAIQNLDSGAEVDYPSWSTEQRERIKNKRAHPFSLVPYLALKRLAITCHEGCSKYGDHNWLYGFPTWSLMNHTIRHLIKWQNGNRDEDHLGHCCWGFMATTHMLIYRPDMCKMRLGEDYELTDEIKNAHPKKNREAIA